MLFKPTLTSCVLLTPVCRHRTTAAQTVLHSDLQHASHSDCTATCSTRHSQTAQPPAAHVTARVHSHLQHTSQPDCQRSAHRRRQDAAHVSRTTEDGQLTSAGPCRPATVSTHSRPRFPEPRFPAYVAWRSEKIFRMYLWWSLCTLYSHACQVRVTVGNSGLCCCACVTSFQH